MYVTFKKYGDENILNKQNVLCTYVSTETNMYLNFEAAMLLVYEENDKLKVKVIYLVLETANFVSKNKKYFMSKYSAKYRKISF